MIVVFPVAVCNVDLRDVNNVLMSLKKNYVLIVFFAMFPTSPTTNIITI